MMYVNLKKNQFGAIDYSIDKYGLLRMDECGNNTFCLQEDSNATNRSVSSNYSENLNLSKRGDSRS